MHKFVIIINSTNSKYHQVIIALGRDAPARDDMPQQDLPQGLLVPQKPIKGIHWHLSKKYIANI